ncbi:acyl-CoA dehydrogenase [Dietzia natronolimnaea]|uniref:Acyl-CoA dehydrogenase n=1 Tax=Dietzia natronolimnaea TaxID=161920 RepID=A0A2A2WMR1_9ACTN|nr:acyl-CoA dehydrogenase family protein [Dietzia natronolimnaea]PAY22506.1 acyl-CoA dehydrogenase [Dietzia natronolimnaea]
MDFRVDDTTTDLTALVRDMGERLVTDDSLRELDARFGPGTEADSGGDRATARFHARYWEELVRAGVPAALAPESLGGAGLGVVGEALVLRELGRVLAPVPLSPAIRAAHLLDAAGLSDRAATIAEGREIAAVGDGASPEVDWAPIADVIVQTTSGGLRVTDRASVSVERTVPVDFSCAGLVSDTGPEPSTLEPSPLAGTALEVDALRRRVHLAAYQWGVIEAALERTAAYASTRHQFGRPIGSFQAVAARLADGSIDVDAVRLSTLRAAYELDACSGLPGAPAHAAVASAHFWACDAGHRLAHTAVHVHGGVGLDRSEPAHRFFLAAKAGEFRLGGATRQLIDLGGVLADHGDPWEYSA